MRECRARAPGEEDGSWESAVYLMRSMSGYVLLACYGTTAKGKRSTGCTKVQLTSRQI